MRLTASGLAPCVRFLLLVCVVAGAAEAAQGSVSSASRGAPSFETVLAEQGERLAQVQDDDGALALYRARLAKALGVSDTLPVLSASAGRSRAATPPPDLKGPALALVKALIQWDSARSLRAAAEQRDMAALSAIPGRERPRQAWLADEGTGPALDRALRLAEVMAALPATPALQAAPGPEERERHAAIDRRYPTLADGEDSWIEVAVRDGVPGIVNRVVREDARAAAASPPATVVRYFHSRLRPIFVAQIVAETIEAEAEARRRATGQWNRLATWRETWSTAHGLARLCGTWQWVVHNHQNHQDHKMVVTFPPPEADRSGPAQPKKIVVLGDSVYLRWEFPGGFQEDSLLFSSRDRRLEGTFVNSQGPYGAITGKRIRPCGATP